MHYICSIIFHIILFYIILYYIILYYITELFSMLFCVLNCNPSDGENVTFRDGMSRHVATQRLGQGGLTGPRQTHEDHQACGSWMRIHVHPRFLNDNCRQCDTSLRTLWLAVPRTHDSSIFFYHSYGEMTLVEGDLNSAHTCNRTSSAVVRFIPRRMWRGVYGVRPGGWSSWLHGHKAEITHFAPKHPAQIRSYLSGATNAEEDAGKTWH